MFGKIRDVMAEKLTSKQLKFAQWYLANKKRLKKFLLIVIIILNIIIWSIAGYQLYKYFSLKEDYEQQMRILTSQQIDYLSLHKHFQPENLIPGKPIFLKLSSVEPKYDFAIKIKNPNKEWLIQEIEYYFVWDNGQTQLQKSFILPKEEKYILVLGQEVDKNLTKAEFVLSNVDWKRINPKDKLLQIPLQLTSKDIKLDYVVSEKEMIALPQISFSIKNESIYDFYQVNLLVILYQNSKIVGINTIPVKNWQSNEQRQIELIWPKIPFYTHIQIVPDINPFDSEIFIPVY